ncbi:MAG: hypothetical protein ACYS5W_25005, partial [Planctomycetota bacterium]
LLQGMTRGLRTVLERVGFMTAASLSDMAVEPTARRSHLEATLLRRLKKSSTSRADGRPLLQKNGGVGQGSAALVHMLIDHYAERVLFFGLLYPAEPQGQFHCVCPDDREQELAAFLALLQHVPDHVPLLHYGEALPRWFTEAGCRHPRTAAVEGRFVNLQKRLRGALSRTGVLDGRSRALRARRRSAPRGRSRCRRVLDCRGPGGTPGQQGPQRPGRPQPRATRAVS